jgi:hypothetical protein
MAEEKLTAAGWDNQDNYTVENIVSATSQLNESNRMDRQIIYEITGIKLHPEDNFEDTEGVLEENLDSGPD